MVLRKYLLLITCLALMLLGYAQALAGSKARLAIQFEHVVGHQPLAYDTVTYYNAKGQPYTISNFKYYISNMVLTSVEGKKIELPGYFLKNLGDESVKRLVFDSLPAGAYRQITFMIGVDSLHNCSGAQVGALDPINAMFWAWNTGYIFLKLEGKSSASTLPGNTIEYHVGGYAAPYNNIRTVTLPFDTTGLNLQNGKLTTLTLKVDASKLFEAPNAIDFSKIPSVTDAQNGSIIADNYVHLFSILNIR